MNWPFPLTEQGGVSFPCPAKLNLFLYITGQRADGYHELQTLFQFLNFGDDLRVEITANPDIVVTPALENVPLEDNLIYRAARLLQAATGCRQGAVLHLTKRLPMGGGVGGGSSDAATALVALNLLWKTGLSREQLAELGLRLGADVPIFVHGHAAFAEGVGERLTPCSPAEKWFVVLKPSVSIATPKIFQHPELTRNTPKRTLDACLHAPYMNDCEKVVKNHYPEVEETLTALLKYAPARLTGTGACVFAEFADEKSAQSCLNAVLNGALRTQLDIGFVAKGCNLSPLYQRVSQLRL